MNKKLLANVRFYFAQSVFNSNCHYKAYSRLEKRKKNISTFVKLISGLTLFLLVLQVIGLENDLKSLLNIVAFIGLLLTGISLIFELFNSEDITLEMCKQNMYAEKYKALRDEYMSLIEEIMSNSSSESSLRRKRKKLQKKYSSIGENAPTTNYKDYQASQKSLGLAGNDNEEFTWSNKEIDKFLPKELRLEKE